MSVTGFLKRLATLAHRLGFLEFFFLGLELLGAGSSDTTVCAELTGDF